MDNTGGATHLSALASSFPFMCFSYAFQKLLPTMAMGMAM